jgi:ribosomal protein S18 acetylase RimI-like enzyme
MLTLNGLCSAHGVIVPMQCEYFALEGLTDLVNTIKQVHANLNRDLKIIGLLRVMFDPRITLQQQVSEQLKAHFGDKVFDTVIPRNVRLAEAPSYGLPGVVFDPARARDGGAGRQALSGLRRHHEPARAPIRPPPPWQRRIEDAGLNASAPPQQAVRRWLAAAPLARQGQARALRQCRWQAGRRPLPDMLEQAQAVFAAAGLPMVVRVTPFTQPASLDAELAARGFGAVDDTRVMVAAGLAGLALRVLPPGLVFEPLGLGAMAQAVGALRGSPLAQRQAHAERLASAPVPFRALALRRRDDGAIVACGQCALEGGLAGLYDVFVEPSARGRGLAQALCTRLLADARQAGAQAAYLQVEADNAHARAVYMKLGFVDGYGYHYRVRP